VVSHGHGAPCPLKLPANTLAVNCDLAGKGIAVSNRLSNAKKVKVPLALVEDLCQFLGHGEMHDELMEIIFKAKEPKRERTHAPENCAILAITKGPCALCGPKAGQRG